MKEYTYEHYDARRGQYSEVTVREDGSKERKVIHSHGGGITETDTERRYDEFTKLLTDHYTPMHIQRVESDMQDGTMHVNIDMADSPQDVSYLLLPSFTQSILCRYKVKELSAKAFNQKGATIFIEVYI